MRIVIYKSALEAIPGRPIRELPGFACAVSAVYISNLQAILLSLSLIVAPTSLVAHPTIQFVPATRVYVGGNPFSLLAGDFNGDGIPDLAATTSEDKIAVVLGNGDGSFRSRDTYPVLSPRAIATGYLNADAFIDLIVGTSNNVVVLLGNGDGTFGAGVPYAAGPSPFDVVIGDLNGDNKADVAVTNDSGGVVSVLLGNGDGTLQTPTPYTTGPYPVFLIAARLDNNPSLDLAATARVQAPGAPGNFISVLLGNGNGTFQPENTYATGAEPGGIVAGDLNADGFIDFAVANDTSGTVSILLGNGDGTFLPQVPYTCGHRPSKLAVGDFDGDRIPDIAVSNYQDDSVSIFVGVGDGSFLPKADFAAGLGPFPVAIADFDGDGAPDVALGDYDAGALEAGTVTVLLNRTSPYGELFKDGFE